jgi:hypothetical protein
VGPLLKTLDCSKIILVKFTHSNEDVSGFIQEILKRGLIYEKNQYNFLGHSNSQIKTSACYFYQADKLEIETLIFSHGNFKPIKNIAKRAKYQGLLFSSCKQYFDLNDFHKIETGKLISSPLI